MSSYRLAVAKKRIVRFVLPPLALLFGVATWMALNHGKWLFAAAFLLLILYIARLASTPSLRAALPEHESGDLSDEELRDLASIMAHVYYVLVIGTIAGAASLGIRFYWIALIALVTWMLARLIERIRRRAALENLTISNTLQQIARKETRLDE
jgi:hypothetical protein